MSKPAAILAGLSVLAAAAPQGVNPVLSCPAAPTVTLPAVAVALPSIPAGFTLVPTGLITALPANLSSLLTQRPSIPAVSLPTLTPPVVTIPGKTLTFTVPGATISPGLPSLSNPRVSVPTPSVPAVSIPSVSVPTFNIPRVSVPTPSVPAVSIPAVSVPSVSVPTLRVPTIPVPSLSTLGLSIPAVSVPPLSVPAVSIPTIPTPRIPRVSIPGVTITVSGIGIPGATINPTALPPFPTIPVPSAVVSAVISATAIENAFTSLNADIPTRIIPTLQEITTAGDALNRYTDLAAAFAAVNAELAADVRAGVGIAARYSATEQAAIGESIHGFTSVVRDLITFIQSRVAQFKSAGLDGRVVAAVKNFQALADAYAVELQGAAGASAQSILDDRTAFDAAFQVALSVYASYQVSAST